MKTRLILILVAVFTIFSATAQELALVKQNDLYGYISKAGEFVIKPQFENSKSFSNNLAAVEKNDKWGYINNSGEWAIEPQYDKAKYFNDGIALVNKDDQWMYINTKGEGLDMPTMEKYYDFNEGVALYRQNDLIGLLGTDGTVVLEPTYEGIKRIRKGHAKAKKGSLWGMINTKGEVVVPFDFNEIGNTFSPNGVYVAKGETFGIYANGSFNAIEGADKVWNFPANSDLTYARKEKKIGFVNNKGEWVIAPQFDKAKAFSNGLAPVLLNKKWGYINEKGEVVIDYQFKDAEVFSADGLAPVKEKQWGFIDKTGTLVIPAEYQITASLLRKDIKGFTGGFARVKSKNGWGFLNIKGELLGNTWYKAAEPFVKNN